VIMPILAQYDVARMAIWALVIGGIIAIVVIVLRQMGVSPPAWVIQILWVLLAVVAGVLAIKFLMGVV
jgi:uncharacterized protein (DUF983 family)